MIKRTLFIFLIALFLLKTAGAADYIVIYNATSTTTITSGWTNPTYAYAPDDLRTYTSTSGAEQEYSGYGINIPSGATINKVWVGLEGYTTDAAYEELYVKIYDGTAWYTKIVTDYSSETLQWIDFTTSTTWTPAKVNSIKTRIYYYYSGGGGGCFPDNTLILVVLNSTHFGLKFPYEIRPGKDYAVIFHPKYGFLHALIEEVIEHTGTWELVKITVNKNVQILNYTLSWKDTLILTSNHLIFSPSYNTKIPAGELKIGDKLIDYSLGMLKEVEIVDIEKYDFEGKVYDIKLEEEYQLPDSGLIAISFSKEQIELLNNFFGYSWRIFRYLNGIGYAIIKVTYYVDWLPVRINYTIQECIRANPSISIIPENQEGNPGQTLTYTVNVTNNDNAVCGASPFNLSTICPENWICTFDLDSLIISPGSSNSTFINVTSPASAIQGSYIFYVNASNYNAPSYWNSTQANYTVLSSTKITMQKILKMESIEFGMSFALVCALITLVFTYLFDKVKNEAYRNFFFLFIFVMIILTFAGFTTTTKYICENSDCSVWTVSYDIPFLQPVIYIFGIMLLCLFLFSLTALLLRVIKPIT